MTGAPQKNFHAEPKLLVLDLTVSLSRPVDRSQTFTLLAAGSNTAKRENTGVCNKASTATILGQSDFGRPS